MKIVNHQYLCSMPQDFRTYFTPGGLVKAFELNQHATKLPMRPYQALDYSASWDHDCIQLRLTYVSHHSFLIPGRGTVKYSKVRSSAPARRAVQDRVEQRVKYNLGSSEPAPSMPLRRLLWCVQPNTDRLSTQP